MHIASCGLDFGTSNSTLGYVSETGEPILIKLENGEQTLPSVLFFSFEDDKTYFGRAAVEEYVTGADGRMMRALKSVLGSSLMKEDTRIKARRIPFAQIIGTFIEEVRLRAEQSIGNAPENVVAGRPVQFVDDDKVADQAAQDQLEEAIRAQGFKHIEFQFEPIAAALDYERQISDEQLALVVDIGGGTSDFTIVRLSPERSRKADRHADILATSGVHVGGTDFDRLLSMSAVMPELGLGSETKVGNRSLPTGPYYDLATWHRINRLYSRQTMVDLRSTRQEAARIDAVDDLIAIVEGRYGHLLASKVEAAKIALTDQDKVNLGFLTDEVALDHAITKEALNIAVGKEAARIPMAIQEALSVAGLTADDIQTVIMTGGSTRMPVVRQGFERMFSSASFVEVDAFGSVGLGLSLDASRRF